LLVSKFGVGALGLAVAVAPGVSVGVVTSLGSVGDVAVAGADVGVGGTESWHPIPRTRPKMRR
jgi:hypothetical protein